jgi:hypothetical protein
MTHFELAVQISASDLLYKFRKVNFIFMKIILPMTHRLLCHVPQFIFLLMKSDEIAFMQKMISEKETCWTSEFFLTLSQNTVEFKKNIQTLIYVF